MRDEEALARILVPIDLSPRSWPALETARRLAEAFGAQVTILHVVQRIENVPQAELVGFYRKLQHTAERRIQVAAKRLAACGIAVRSAVLIGDPPREIARQAARSRADLVVLGSHRVDPTEPGRSLGTTSYKAAILCACPVLLVK